MLNGASNNQETTQHFSDHVIKNREVFKVPEENKKTNLNPDLNMRIIKKQRFGEEDISNKENIKQKSEDLHHFRDRM